jgi:hypothetical protein
MTWLLINLLLAALFFAIWVGVPLWLVLKRPDQDHQPQAPTGPSHSRRNATGCGGLHPTATSH